MSTRNHFLPLAAVILNFLSAQLQAAPLIIAQPTNKSVFNGDASVTFNVLATGTPAPTYQWQYKDNLGGAVTNITGATSSTLTVSLPNPATTLDGYQYRCVVTSGASINSAAATLHAYIAPLPSLNTAVTVTPNTVAANSGTNITIQITGLSAPGDTVRVERILDMNTNGKHDIGEPLVQSFFITDGQVTSVGGAVNTNVPGDDDGLADGKITTHISLPSSPELARTAGTYLIRVSSPTGKFRPVQATLTVTQPSYGQSVKGQVQNSGTGIPYAMVVLLLNNGNGNYFASTVADASGNFTLNAPVGDYQLMAAQGGYVSSLSAGPFFSLTAGQTLTAQNPQLTPATSTIAGQVTDVFGTTKLAGVQMICASSTNNYFTGTFSDANGNYVAATLADQWNIMPSDFSLALLSYVPAQNNFTAEASDGTVTAQNMQFAPAAALISGTVKDIHGTIRPGVVLNASIPNSAANGMDATTDANGRFGFAVAGNGTWNINLSSDYANANNIVGSSISATVINTQSISNLAFQIADGTGTINGTVLDSGSNPVTQTGVYANATLNGLSYSAYANTDNSGKYTFPIVSGTWTVGVNTSGYADQTLTVTGASTIVNFTPIPIIAHLTGTVTKNGTAASGVNIGASLQNSGSGNTWVSATTGADGSFDLGVTSNGTWQINLDSNYADANNLVGPMLVKTVSNNQSISSIAFPIVDGTRLISGTVLDSGSNPISASVYANAVINGINYFSYADASTSGSYSLPVISGTWTLGVNSQVNLNFAQQTAIITGSSATVNFMPPTAVAHLTGTVTKNGAAVSGATIGASLQTPPYPWISTTTGTDGSFDIGVTSNGTWNVSLENTYANSNNLVGPNLQETVTNNQDISNITLQIVNGTGTIGGTVKDASNNLLINTNVYAFATINGIDYNANANTDNNGTYSFPVVSGTWTVGVNSPSINFPQQAATVTGLLTTVNFAAPPIVAHLTGTATINGSGVSGVSIGTWLQTSGNSPWIMATTGSDGSFDLGVTSNGTWNIALESVSANRSYFVGPILSATVANNTNVANINYKISVGTGLMSGSVVDSGSNPIANVGVNATATINGFSYFETANTDSNGNYRFPIISGTWTANVVQPGFIQQTVIATGGMKQVNFILPTPFQLWQQTEFDPAQAADPNISGPTAKVPSGAGFANQLAYALGVNPNTARVTDLPKPGKAITSGTNYPTITFTRNTSANDITYIVEASNDLVQWSTLNSYGNGAWSQPGLVIESGSSSIINVQIRDTQPLPAPKRFLRLKVTH